MSCIQNENEILISQLKYFIEIDLVSSKSFITRQHEWFSRESFALEITPVGAPFEDPKMNRDHLNANCIYDIIKTNTYDVHVLVLALSHYTCPRRVGWLSDCGWFRSGTSLPLAEFLFFVKPSNVTESSWTITLTIKLNKNKKFITH